jgi:hypothetical protein
VTASLRVTVSRDDVTLALRRDGDAPPSRRAVVSRAVLTAISRLPHSRKSRSSSHPLDFAWSIRPGLISTRIVRLSVLRMICRSRPLPMVPQGVHPKWPLARFWPANGSWRECPWGAERPARGRLEPSSTAGVQGLEPAAFPACLGLSRCRRRSSRGSAPSHARRLPVIRTAGQATAKSGRSTIAKEDRAHCPP